MSIDVLRAHPVDAGWLLLGTVGGDPNELHERERALISPRATAKRRAELVAGRLLAKAALRKVFGGGEWIIERETGEHEGAPRVVGPAPGHVSISHTDGLVVAFASRRPAAIDLVKLEPLAESLCEEAFTPLERRAWHGDMATAFAAKEAALKWLAVGMGRPLHSIEVLPRRRDALDVIADERRRTLSCFTLTHGEWLSLALFDGSS